LPISQAMTDAAGPDVAGPALPDVHTVEATGDEQRERDGAEQVAPGGKDDREDDLASGHDAKP
jgi:hypothetical protein